MKQGGSDGGVNLEEAFFADENARLLEGLRKKAEHEDRRSALRDVVSIDDEKFLDRLISMGIGPEQAMALRLIPLIFVAWADGNVDEREREAILQAASKHNLTSDKLARRMLEGWLERRPDPEILLTWKGYIRRIWDRFSDAEQIQMRNNLITSTREVASAAGGFLGPVGNGIGVGGDIVEHQHIRLGHHQVFQ